MRIPLVNPYAEIETTPLFAKDGMPSNGWSVRLYDEENAEGPDWREVGIVSKSYLLVPNQKIADIQDMVVSKIPFAKNTPDVFFDGKHFMRTITVSHEKTIAVGDVVRMGLAAYNSYDGTRRASMSLYAERLRCSNGMTSRNHFLSYIFKHDNQQVHWEEEIQRAFSIVAQTGEQQFDAFCNRLEALQKTPITVESLREERCLKTGLLHKLTDNEFGRVTSVLLNSQNFTRMGVLNALTQIYWHSNNWGNITKVSSFVDGMLPLLPLSTN